MDFENVIEYARQGEKKALECLYNTYYRKMKGVCAAILKEDKDAVDDLVHDAFIIAFASLNKLSDLNKFGQWLTTITRNVAFKYLEQRRKSQLMHLSELSVEQQSNITDETEIDEAHISLNELFRLINQLPDGYRKVFKLSVVEGFSHKEIANMLGIEPHSSSSQLSRAKVLLRKMLSEYLALIILAAIILLVLYKQSDVNTPQKIVKPTDNISKADGTVDDSETTIGDTERNAVPINENKNKCDEVVEATEIYRPDFTYISVEDVLNKEDYTIIEDISDRDSSRVRVDSTICIPLPTLDIDRFDAHGINKRRWKMVLAGSLGPALAQNAYKLIVGGESGDVDSDTPIVPTTISTWEEYYDYLLSRSHDDMPADTVALLNIAKNNSGDIVEREKHEKPITFGLSFTKTLNDKWSIETGLQYSLLRSSVTMGSGMNYIQKSQKLHYIGIPLKVSYRIIDYRKFSVYGSAGVVVNIPVKGKVGHELVTDTMSMRLSDNRVTPPWQWSVNASLGVQYELLQNVNIYFEPTLNYYIHSGCDLHTIWTEQPFTVTMPVGIRITW